MDVAEGMSQQQATLVPPVQLGCLGRPGET